MGITEFLGEEESVDEALDEEDSPAPRQDPEALIRSIETQLLELRRALG